MISKSGLTSAGPRQNRLSRMDTFLKHAACFNRVHTTTSSSAPKPVQIISSFTVRQSVTSCSHAQAVVIPAKG